MGFKLLPLLKKPAMQGEIMRAGINNRICIHVSIGGSIRIHVSIVAVFVFMLALSFCCTGIDIGFSLGTGSIGTGIGIGIGIGIRISIAIDTRVGTVVSLLHCHASS